MLQKFIFIIFMGFVPSFVIAQEEVELVDPIEVLMQQRQCTEEEAMQYYDDLAGTIQEVKSSFESLVNEHLTPEEAQAQVQYLSTFFDANALIEVSKLNTNGTYTVSEVPIRNYLKRLAQYGKQGNVSLEWLELKFQKTEKTKTIVTVTQTFERFSKIDNRTIYSDVTYKDIIFEETPQTDGTFKFKVRGMKVMDTVPFDKNLIF